VSKAIILFAVWCVALGAGALAAAFYGWSPYADASGHPGGAPTHGQGGHGGAGGGYFYGPMHK
jgi:hypothetical protein